MGNIEGPDGLWPDGLLSSLGAEEAVERARSIFRSVALELESAS